MDNYLGAIFSKKDVRDYRAVCSISNIEFPEEFTLDLSKIKSQGKINSCVAHSLSTIIEYFNKKQLGIDDEMSTGYIYGNRRNSSYTGEGMVIREALANAKIYGDVKSSDFPYNIEVPEAIEKFEESSIKLFDTGYVYRISSYCKLENEADIKQALMKNGPVIIGMTWYADMIVVNGVLTSFLDENDKRGGHAMVLYGWDSRGWKVHNSWGTKWGDKGCAIIPYDMKIREAWTIVDDVIEGMEIVKPYSTDIGKIVAKLLNLFWTMVAKFKKE